MDVSIVENRLRDAVEPHNLLCHPFYQAWSAGLLTRDDLRDYAAQYQHQVEAVPELLASAAQGSTDAESRQVLERNLAEELGAGGEPHSVLWKRFVEALGEERAEPPAPETRESGERLRELSGRGGLEGLAALWAYELQTSHVARTKLVGLAEHYDLVDPRASSFFSVHEELDVHHARALVGEVARCCVSEADLERACLAATASVQAQWLFLDGAQARRKTSHGTAGTLGE